MKTKAISLSTISYLLHLVFTRRATTRAELARLTGLSASTIVRLIAELREQGFLFEGRDTAEPPTRGRPTDTLHINPHCGHAVGLEFGENRLTMALTDAVGNVVHSERLPAPEFDPVPETMDTLIAHSQHVLHDLNVPWESVRGFSVALHDVVSASGDWIAWSKPGSEAFPAQRYLEERLGIVAQVEDISRAFAFAEHRHGAGRGPADCIYVYIGEQGIGSGIIMNNALLKSSSGICGEIGHLVVDTHGPLCQCGNRGCLVTHCAAGRLVEKAQAMLRQGVVSSLSSSSSLDFAQICRAAETGDKVAHLILQEAAAYLARALAMTLSILGTPLVIIGGQITLAGSGFLADVNSLLRQQAIPALSPQIDVRYAALPKYAGAWGAALQILDTAWSKGSFAPLAESPNAGSNGNERVQPT